jgi:hypothetical protein
MDTKPWYMTSEAWVMIATQVLAVLSITGVLTPAQADVLTKQISVIAGSIIAIASAFGYTWNRTQIKRIRADLIARTHDANVNGKNVTSVQATTATMKQAGL